MRHRLSWASLAIILEGDAASAYRSKAMPIIMPYIQVVGGNGSLTGYAGGLDAKQFLLDLERKNQ